MPKRIERAIQNSHSMTELFLSVRILKQAMKDRQQKYWNSLGKIEELNNLNMMAGNGN